MWWGVRSAGATAASITAALGLWLLPATSSALDCTETCQNARCGFTFGSVACQAVPANHQLRLTVTCSSAVLPAAWPQLFDEAGNVLESEWQPSGRSFAEFFQEPPTDPIELVRVGPDLPIGARLRVAGRVPAQCTAALRSGACSGDALICNPDIEGDCCNSYRAAGLEFYADEIAAAGAGGQSSLFNDEPGATAPADFEYLTFTTTAPDREAPAALGLELDCFHWPNPEGQPEYVEERLDTSGVSDAELAEIVAVEIYLRDTNSGSSERRRRLHADLCIDGEMRVFQASAEAPITLDRSARLEMFARSIDQAGNFSDGPAVPLDDGVDCSEARNAPSYLVELSHQCPAAASALACAPAPPDDGASAEVCASLGESFSGSPLSSPASASSGSATSNVTSTAGTSPSLPDSTAQSSDEDSGEGSDEGAPNTWFGCRFVASGLPAGQPLGGPVFALFGVLGLGWLRRAQCVRRWVARGGVDAPRQRTRRQ